MGNSAAKCLQCVPETGAAGERLSFWYTAYLVQKEIFDSLDANQDGVISVQEWGDGVAKHKDVIAKFFGGATIEEISRQFARIDANNDEKLSWDEMLAAAGITDA